MVRPARAGRGAPQLIRGGLRAGADEQLHGGHRSAATQAPDLVAFHDRFAAAALAYCAYLCAPAAIGDAVEAAWTRLFAAAGSGGSLDPDELERTLRAALRAEALMRAPAGANGALAPRLDDAGRAFRRLAAGGPPPLGRSALARAPDGVRLAAFYDRHAAAALAYCARLRPPDALAGAVDAAFARMFHSRPAAEPAGEDELRAALRTALSDEVGAGAEAKLAFNSLAGDQAPVLGRSLLAEALGRAPARGGRRLARDVLPEPPKWLRRAVAGAPWLPPLGARGRRRLAVGLLVVGVLLLVEAGLTVLWKEPFTAYLGARAQDRLVRQLDRRAAEQSIGAADARRLASIPGGPERARAGMSLLARRERTTVREGDALGMLSIKRLGLEAVVVKGTASADLRKGPGFYDRASSLPGEGRITGIAGHRTTYGAPFRKLDSLRSGDVVTLRMPYGLFTYRVERREIVPSHFLGAFDGGGGGDRLILSACHPVFSDAKRLLVYAALVSERPLGVAAGAPGATPPARAGLDRERVRRRLAKLGSRPLTLGMTGAAVRELQHLLGLPRTGTFDANTAAAVRAFQQRHRLPVTGVVGERTKHALARRKRIPLRPPTPVPVQPAVPAPSPQAAPPSTTTPPPGAPASPPASGTSSGRSGY